MKRVIAYGLAAALLGGCGGSPVSEGAGGAGSGASTSSNGSSAGAGGSCPRSAAPPDRVRTVLVSRPYDAGANPSKLFEVLTLAQDGTLARPGVTFELGRATYGKVAFTPDGAVAIAVDEDGDLGVVRFEAPDQPTVVHAKFHGSFYAGTVAVEAAGDTAIVLDPNWRENGGGVYRVRIACDGTLTDLGLVAEAKLAGGLAWLANGTRAVVAASDFLQSAAGDSAHLVAFSPKPALFGGANAFGDDLAIVSAIAATHDEKYALIGDNSEFSGIPTRVAVVSVAPGGLTATQVLSPLEDPYDLVTSPFDDAALVVSGYGSALVALDYDPTNAASPFSIRGEIAYTGAKPALPAGAVAITRGALTGLVLVAENVGVRRVQFSAGGAVDDLGAFSLGSGTESITGAIGVAP